MEKQQAESETEMKLEAVGVDKSFLDSWSDVIMAAQIKRINISLSPPSSWLRFQLKPV